MKFSPRTFRLQWDLHAWVGVIASLFLFVIFFCGVFALFHEQFSVWQQPDLQLSASRHAHAATPPTSIDSMLSAVRRHEPLRPGQNVGFHWQHDTRFVASYLWDEKTGDEKTVFVDPETGRVVPQRSQLGEQLYYMHFFYRLPGGMQWSGVMGVALLIALISGLVMHLKDLRRQVWQYRPRLKLRFSASDAHKVLGVFGLPFALLFGWSGALLGLSSLLGAGTAELAYQGDQARVEAYAGYASVEREASNVKLVAGSLDGLVARARQAVGAEHAALHYVSVALLDDENAYLSVYFENASLEPTANAVISVKDGAVLAASSERYAPAGSFGGALYDLHFGQYGGLLLKVLYALLALAVCAVIVTGNLVWLERRDPRRERLGQRILERLTSGIPAGLLAATAVYTLANRVIPWNVSQRAELEFSVFVASWGLFIVVAFVPQWSARRVAQALCGGAALGFCGVVLSDLMLREVHLLNAHARDLDAVWIAELCLLMVAAGSALMALLLRPSSQATALDAVADEDATPRPAAHFRHSPLVPENIARNELEDL